MGLHVTIAAPLATVPVTANSPSIAGAGAAPCATSYDPVARAGVPLGTEHVAPAPVPAFVRTRTTMLLPPGSSDPFSAPSRFASCGKSQPAMTGGGITASFTVMLTSFVTAQVESFSVSVTRNAFTPALNMRPANVALASATVVASAAAPKSLSPAARIEMRPVATATGVVGPRRRLATTSAT